ncbi:MAG: hypothetical protein EBR73_17185, partial [Rhodobacteraceae bacterium]|nr:hypothetical protein [Paracoccaceae bacterium]
AFISFLHKGDKSSYNAGDNVNVNEEGNAEMLTKEDLMQALAANAEQMQSAVNAAVEPLQAQVKALQDKLAANENAEKAELVGKVVALDIGINEETANTMTAAALNSVLAKNGQVNTGFGGAQRGANSAEPTGLEFGNPFKA